MPGALAACVGSEIGGLTARTLSQTSSASSELFIYDLAVRRDYHRHGVGRFARSRPVEKRDDRQNPSMVRLIAVGETQFVQQMVDMLFDGALRHVERLGNAEV